MSCLCYLYFFGSSLPSVVCRRAHVLFMLFVFVWFFFTFSCLYEDSCLVYVILLSQILWCGCVLSFFVLLPVSLDSPFVIAPSIVSNVYFLTVLMENRYGNRWNTDAPFLSTNACCQLVRKDMDINEEERLSNITVRHNIK
jgi:hypothetical protein